MANGREETMEGSRKTLDGLPKNTRATMMSKSFLQAMPALDDDKWYISDAAISAMPALINTLEPAGSSAAELKKYAHTIGLMAHLIGVEMLLCRNSTYEAIETVSKEEENASA
jgi:hypothetical protein